MLSEKEERLKSRKSIEYLFTNGNVINHFPLKLLFGISENKEHEYLAKIAVSVSKRNYKRAVDRNHIKRKLREAYRKNKQSLHDYLAKTNQNVYFIVIYVAKEDIQYQVIENEMKLLIEKLIKQIKLADCNNLK
ncbi:MAG: ribonuclease P protein component [Bacteroidales bacterium]|nr:ribonuclease P protein component [Bacteroidales bacterium]